MIVERASKVKAAKDMMRLHRIERADGKVFHLFEEHAGLVSKLLLENGKRREDCRSSREILFCKENDFEFVAKKERGKLDRYRLKYPHLSGKNPILKEVMIARALSIAGTYEDEEFRVRYERPYGYVELPTGEKYALFELIPNFLPGNSNNALTQEIRQIVDNLWGVIREINLEEHIKNAKKYELMEELAGEIPNVLLPGIFGRLVLAYNGIDHNETSDKDSISYDETTGRRTSTIIDFEFCVRANTEQIRKELQEIYQQLDPEIFYHDIDRLVGSEIAWKMMEQSALLIKKADRLLGIRCASDIEKMTRFGLVYDLLEDFEF